METLFSIRKDNLGAIVNNKFGGNKAALARAVKVHPNHINLLLSSNEVHRRNLGEGMARQLEEALGLPPLWLDNPHDADSAKKPVNIPALPIDASISKLLTTSEITALGVGFKVVDDLRPEVTAVENLFLAQAVADCSPHVSPGDTVVIDAGVKAYTAEGVYLLVSKGKEAYMRHIRKSMAGPYIFSGGGSQDQMDTMKGFAVLGRVVRRVQITRL